METLRIKRLTLDATLPTRASPGSVGYDLYSMENMKINACERGIVSTGICATIPNGVDRRIAPRSGLSVKHGIQTGAGVIDPDYTGELKVILFNHGSESFEIKQGDRIAQLILDKSIKQLEEEIRWLYDIESGENTVDFDKIFTDELNELIMIASHNLDRFTELLEKPLDKINYMILAKIFLFSEITDYINRGTKVPDISYVSS